MQCHSKSSSYEIILSFVFQIDESPKNTHIKFHPYDYTKIKSQVKIVVQPKPMN